MSPFLNKQIITIKSFWQLWPGINLIQDVSSIYLKRYLILKDQDVPRMIQRKQIATLPHSS